MSNFHRGSSHKPGRKNTGSRKNKSSKQSDSRFSTKNEVKHHGLSSPSPYKIECHETSISELPLEILDMILQKSYLLCVLGGPRIERIHDFLNFHHQAMPTASNVNAPNRVRDKDIIVKLASVDFCWFQRIIKRRFKRTVWRYLTGLYRKHEKGAAVMRVNKRYLLNTMKSDDSFVRRLLSARCITETQMKRTNRLFRYRDRNAMLLRAICFRDDNVHLSFVKCLRDTNQHLIARVAESGGVVAEVKVRNRKIPNRKLVEKQVTEYLSYFRDKPRSPEVGKVLDLLKMYQMEILQTYRNKGIVIWIWCKTKEALQKFQEMAECNGFNDIVRKLLKYFSSNSERHFLVPRNIIIDNDIFTRAVVSIVHQRPVAISFSTRLEGRESDYATGITKLGKEIYVLCRSYHSPESNSVLVFEDHARFRLQRLIKISGIKQPTDIGSNMNERCLHVADQRQQCVWKVSEEIGLQVTKWLTGLGASYSVSFCTSGQILIVKPRDPLSSLEVYGPDAELIRSVQLIVDIQKPRHAVETSTGGFIVVHEWREGPDKRWMQVVSEVSMDGSMVVRRFCRDHTEEELTEPVYLLLDSENQVFVADRGRSGKVVLLDSDLRWNRILCPNKDNTERSSKITAPWRLYYDMNKQQLMVAAGTNARDGGVNVYTLQHK